jgi:hypothetical protein
VNAKEARIRLDRQQQLVSQEAEGVRYNVVKAATKKVLTLMKQTFECQLDQAIENRRSTFKVVVTMDVGIPTKTLFDTKESLTDLLVEEGLDFVVYGQAAELFTKEIQYDGFTIPSAYNGWEKEFRICKEMNLQILIP